MNLEIGGCFLEGHQPSAPVFYQSLCHAKKSDGMAETPPSVCCICQESEEETGKAAG